MTAAINTSDGITSDATVNVKGIKNHDQRSRDLKNIYQRCEGHLANTIGPWKKSHGPEERTHQIP